MGSAYRHLVLDDFLTLTIDPYIFLLSLARGWEPRASPTSTMKKVWFQSYNPQRYDKRNKQLMGKSNCQCDLGLSELLPRARMLENHWIDPLLAAWDSLTVHFYSYTQRSTKFLRMVFYVFNVFWNVSNLLKNQGYAATRVECQTCHVIL